MFPKTCNFTILGHEWKIFAKCSNVKSHLELSNSSKLFMKPKTRSKRESSEELNTANLTLFLKNSLSASPSKMLRRLSNVTGSLYGGSNINDLFKDIRILKFKTLELHC